LILILNSIHKISLIQNDFFSENYKSFYCNLARAWKLPAKGNERLAVSSNEVAFWIRCELKGAQHGRVCFASWLVQLRAKLPVKITVINDLFFSRAWPIFAAIKSFLQHAINIPWKNEIYLRYKIRLFVIENIRSRDYQRIRKNSSIGGLIDSWIKTMNRQRKLSHRFYSSRFCLRYALIKL